MACIEKPIHKSSQPMRGRYRSFIAVLIVESVLLATRGNYVESTLNAASGKSADLPQHRIKRPKRSLLYSSNHPWSRRSTGGFEWNENSHDSAAGKRTRRESSNQRQLMTDNDDIILEEYLSKSDITMWSVASGGSLHAGYNHSEVSRLHENIRIRAVLLSHESTGAAFLSDAQRVVLLRDIVRPALDTWSRSLSVVPVKGNLTVDQSQLYDEQSCGPGIESGLPSVAVPLDHFEDGVADTDLLVYLNIGFHGDLFKDLSSRRKLAKSGGSSLRIPNVTMQQDMEGMDEGSAVFSNDTVATDSMPIGQVPACSGTYLASSTYCSTDQFDRPVAGMLHLCISHSFFDTANIQYGQITVLHELGHILGFNSQSLAHFRDRNTGAPITPRDSNGDVMDQRIECTGAIETRGYATVPLPSLDILRFEEVRGGKRVAQIVTPNVRQIVRNHFDCQSLIGAELESSSHRKVDGNNETDFVDECISDHWERRLFKADIMNPIIDSVLSSSHISALTLAYFMDSGWYEVNATTAADPDIWGRAEGCSFVHDRCILQPNYQVLDSLFFCSRSDEEGCSDDMMGKAKCSMALYTDELPVEYQYFDNPKLGGGDPALDFCPVFMGSSRELCDRADSRISRLEEFGVQSRCLNGKAGRKDSASLCVPIACVIDEKAIYVRVDEIWNKCDFEGQVIQSWYDDEEFVICPDIIQTCPSFYCPRDCLNADFVGLCDYETGTCRCHSSVFDEHDAKDCNITVNYEFLEGSSSSMVYVQSSDLLESDEKSLLDFTMRMFIQMNAGEVVGFVATSIITIGICFIIFTGCYRCMKQQGTGLSLPTLGDKEWRVDSMWQAIESSAIGSRRHRNNKDKMVATVLHNMRVETALSASQNDPLSETSDERTFHRSEMPPLPGAGRIISVVGAKFVDDSVLPSDAEEALSIDGTANDSATSDAQELDSHHCTAMDECMDEESVGHCSVELPFSLSQTRRRLKKQSQ